MGRVVVVYRFMMDSPERDIEGVTAHLEERVRRMEGVELRETRIEDVAFGIRAAACTFLLDEREGLVDDLERTLATLEGVASLENVSVSLL